MSRPLRIQFPDAWYHVMNRGRRGEKELVEDYNIKIAAYCLMSKRNIDALKFELNKGQA